MGLETLDLRAESIHGGSAYSCITGFTANLTDPEDTNRKWPKTFFFFEKLYSIFLLEHIF